MRKFIDIVAEGSRSPYMGTEPLYHGTDLLGLISILASDKMTPSIDDQHPDNHGVSLTYDLPMARSFAERSAYIFSENHNHPELDLGPVPYHGAVLELNTAALRNDFRLVNYVDHLIYNDHEDGDEKEVRALGTIQPLSSYLVGFEFNANDIDWYRAWLTTDYARKHSGYNVDFYLGKIDEIARHPRCR